MAVLDMDCRAGNHGGCIGPPGTRCDCRCHQRRPAALCGRCKTNPVHRPGEMRPDGQPQDTALYCYACIDRCHEATDFAHICIICASPEERAGMQRTGWFR